MVTKMGQYQNMAWIYLSARARTSASIDRINIICKMSEVGCILFKMRTAVLVIPVLLGLVYGTFAQAEERECPTISVTGPAGITRPGEPIMFSVELTGAPLQDVIYTWTLSTGKVVEGQGSNAITMVYDRNGSSITASVEVAGLGEGCPSGASETLSYCEGPVPILVAEGFVPVASIDKARLNKLASELAVAPNTQGYLIEYFPSKTSQKAIDAKIRLTLQHLKKSVDETRITIVTDTASNAFTKYYIVPPGASNPTP
jgi:hypothetical protein